MANKKRIFFAAVFTLSVFSFFGEWIDSEKISFVSYSYFLMALYLARCYLFCILTMGALGLCKKQIGLFFEAAIFLPVVAGSVFVLIGFSFNAMTLYSRIVTVLQIAAIAALFAKAAALFYERQKFAAQKIEAQKQINFSKLSKREKEVAALLLAGKKNDEIAEALFVSTATVKSHIQHIFEKYNARNRMEFAAKINCATFE